MQTLQIIQEIQQLPLAKKFYIMEQTLKSIKKEELNLQTKKSTVLYDDNTNEDFNQISYLVSEKSLATDWLSEEDSRWDKIL